MAHDYLDKKLEGTTKFNESTLYNKFTVNKNLYSKFKGIGDCNNDFIEIIIWSIYLRRRKRTSAVGFGRHVCKIKTSGGRTPFASFKS